MGASSAKGHTLRIITISIQVTPQAGHYGILIVVNLISQMNGMIRYIWDMKVIIRLLNYNDESMIWKCAFRTFSYPIWFSWSWSVSRNVIWASPWQYEYLLRPHVEIMIWSLLGRRKSSPQTKNHLKYHERNHKLTVNDHTNLKM